MSPICYLGDSTLVCYKYGIFYIYDISTCKLVKKIRTSFSFLEYVVARVKCINRFFRLGVKCAIPLSFSSFAYYCQNRIYEMDIETGKVSNTIMKWVRPLKFTEVKGKFSYRVRHAETGTIKNFDAKEVNKAYFRVYDHLLNQ